MWIKNLSYYIYNKGNVNINDRDMGIFMYKSIYYLFSFFYEDVVLIFF